MSELMLLLPWNLFKLASFSLLLSPPKYISELIDLAFPNLLTAAEPDEAVEEAAGAFLGLHKMGSLGSRN